MPAVEVPARAALIALIAVGAGLHFFRLSDPPSLVFDEVHFGRFVTAYCASGERFLDIHPPHAKLLVAGVASLSGCGAQQRFAAIGEPLTAVSPLALRALPALAGTLVPAIVFGLLRQLGASAGAALLGGLMLLLDNALLVQTRMLALDGMLVASELGSLATVLAALRCRRRVRRAGLSLLAGALAGLAAGTKLTGLWALGMAGALLASLWLAAPTRARLRGLAGLAVWLLSGAALAYAMGWWLHFALLDRPGPGDAWGVPTGEWLLDTLRSHRQMLAANYGLAATHPYASPWWSWPLMLRPVWYWAGDGAVLYFLGNPVVWWGSSLGVAAATGAWAWRRLVLRERRPASGQRLWIPALGYALALAPLAIVPRALFLYHYLTALVCAVCLTCLWLDRRCAAAGTGSWGLPHTALLAAVVLGFVATSPFSFAFVELPAYRELVFSWLPGWR